MNQVARQRIRLHKLDARCFYCGIITVLDTPSGWRGVPYPGLATVEHLRPRTHPSRREPARGPNEQRHVLACWQCNQDRSNRTPVELRRALSVIGHIKDARVRQAARECVLTTVTDDSRNDLVTVHSHVPRMLADHD
jgi:5-methylcytosine-specific restriction endonuclease McrA